MSECLFGLVWFGLVVFGWVRFGCVCLDVVEFVHARFLVARCTFFETV